jgi:hypothetical protein
MLIITLMLVGFEKVTPQKRGGTGMLAWLNAPKINPTDFPWGS